MEEWIRTSRYCDVFLYDLSGTAQNILTEVSVYFKEWRHIPKNSVQFRHHCRGEYDYILSNVRGLEMTDLPLWPFSGVAFNWYAHSKVHMDGGDGPYAVLTVSGNFKGGYVCLAGLNLSFELRPGEVIIFNSRRVPHFNLSYEGERHSFVFYTQHLLDAWVADGNGWDGHRTARG
jgi:hypothetical protein